MNKIAIAAWVAGLVGFGLLVSGIALVSIPLALIVAGLSMIGWAWLADRAAARIQDKRNPAGG